MIRIVHFLALLLAINFGCSQQQPMSRAEKINGVSFVSPPNVISDSLVLIPKDKVNANWLSLMPFGFLTNNSPTVNYNVDWQWWGEKSAGIISMIRMAKKGNYHIMLKPQLWIHHGAFTGHLSFEKESDWKLLESSYKDFILEFARIAELEKLDLFCLGTELEAFVTQRPEYWETLIHEVRMIYSGKITYAANWDEFERNNLWDQLDFIGVDAYFPISKKERPTVKDIKLSWDDISLNLKATSEKYSKPILFTEYGIRSKVGGAIQPWESNPSGDVNLDLQANFYSALFETIWKEDFFAGGFLWKWFPDHGKAGGSKNNGFTPQNKKAEKIINEFYGLYSAD